MSEAHGPTVAAWTARREDQLAHARRAWAQDEMDWGIWSFLEADVRALPDVAGKDVVELGCGTAYFSSWLARRGARVVGVDPTPSQLEIARTLQAERGLEFPLVQAAGESVPLPDAGFDLVLSEYGASIWADPYRWIPEAARLLRPGGELVFLRNSTLLVLCSPDDESPVGTRLVRDEHGLHRIEWPDDGSVEYQLPHGEWIALLRASGFELLDLIELRPPAGATTRYDFVSLEWARRWPTEEIWRARLR